MDSSSGGEKDGGGDGDSISGSLGPNLHDHSDLLIPNPSFSSPPGSVSSTASSSMMMNITSPCSDHDLQNKHKMDCQMTSPQQPMDNLSVGGHQMDYAMSPNEEEAQRPDGSPPNVVVDDSPLQPCMDRNKESLKVKLQLRRPMNQLVEQGILPPPKTPAAFASQRVRLERARMGDLLRAKIQQRPARQELIRQHILEDTDSRVDPSLADKQRKLKRARLADSLNDHLIHRPGPLELVQKNILHAPDADIEKAIKDGIVNFKATCEGHVPGPSLPNKYIVNEDDSSSDISSPAGTPDASSSGPNTEANTPISKQSSDPAICLPSAVSPSESCEVTLQPAKTNKSETVIPAPPPPPPPPPPLPPQLILTTSAIPTSHAQVKQITAPAAIFQVATPNSVIPPPPPLPTINHIQQATPQTIVLSDGAVRDLLPQLQSAGFQLAAAHVQKPPSQSSSTLGKTRSSKKSSKSKSQPKARTIKFHEYKGPSNSQHKGGSSSSSSGSLSSKAESSYELLLKQQQLFLQWQLEWQHKYPQILLPAAPKISPGGVGNSNTTKTLSSFPVTTLPASLCTNLLNSNNQQSSQQPTITVVASTSNNGNASPKNIPVALAPKVADIAPKPVASSESCTEPKSVSSDVAVPSPASSTCSSTTEKSSIKALNLQNISEWKVNDLKAELKKRSLPVSGSKSQLVERLKAAAAKEAASETKSSSVKMDIISGDENSNEAMMDTSSGNDEKIKSTSSSVNIATTSAPPAAAILIQSPSSNGTINPEGSISLADIISGKVNGLTLQNILDLLRMSAVANANNNVDSTNNGSVNNNPSADNNSKNSALPQVNAVNQLPITALVTTGAKSGVANSESSAGSNLEQQKQLLELQKEVTLTQQKIAQQKDSKVIGPQEHRQVLRNHIQQKQKYQSQMQNLMQMQTQQAEQKKQHEQAPAQVVIIRSNANAEDNKNDPFVTTLPKTIANGRHQEQINANNHWIIKPEQGEQQVIGLQNENGDTLSLEDLVQTIDTKDIPKLEPQTKSQMVDDVLEILIRTGELPPSAAQDPQPKALISSSSSVSGLNAPQSKKTVQPPPPPPPLPPPTFSVMLPTSIPFSRHQTTNNTDFLTFGMANVGRTEENLSKEAEAILRISEDLSNYGKSREAEAAAVAAGLKLATSNNNNNNSSCVPSMDLGFFSRNASHASKDFDLCTASSTADSMDIGFNDTHSVSLHSGNPKTQLANHQEHFNNSPFDFTSIDQSTSTPSLKSDDGDHHQTNNEHPFIDDLHLDMQMDTDYSDWLDTLCSTTNNTVSSTSTTAFPSIDQHNHDSPHLQHPQQPDAAKKFTNNLLNHNNNFSNSANHVNNSSLFSSIMDESNHQNQLHNHHSQQRDPLLSSRSFASGLTTMSSSPFRDHLQQNNHCLPNNFLFPNTMNPSYHGPASLTLGSTSSGTTLMDTDFDDMSSTSTCHNSTKKSDNNIISNNVIMPEMPSTTPNNIVTPITTSSINDNFLWDF